MSHASSLPNCNLNCIIFRKFSLDFLNEIGEMMLICLIHSFMFKVAVYVDY